MKSFASVLVIAFLGLAASQFVELQPVDYENNQTILESLNFGASHLMKDAVERDVLPDGDYEITIVSKVEQQVSENGTEFRFELDIAGPRNTHVQGDVTVGFEEVTGEKKVTQFFYRYYYDLIDSETGEAYEDTESANEEAEFSWEWYEFEQSEYAGEEANFEGEEWFVETNILPVN